MHYCIVCGEECRCSNDHSDTERNTPAHCESCGCSDHMDVHRVIPDYVDELEPDDFDE